ncbi:MAG: DUF3027 domain-containing protein [Streptosporangiaceae bacterium]
MSHTRSKFRVDEVCAEAIETAREAAAESARPGQLGDHLGAEADGERLVTHSFACRDPGYHGWRWAVTVTRAARAKKVTVSESVLLPGPGAILAPEWVPWRERLQPGDLGAGDLLPTPRHDERLAPGLADAREEAEHQEFWELGLGRPRVLSEEGRDVAAERWYDGDHGPDTAIAKAAPGRCATCGFFVLLQGPLRQLFGVCANEQAPDDGRVVSADHGCGAHSEAVVVPPVREPVPPIVDEVGYDAVVRPQGSVEEADEPLGHS